MAVGKKSIYSFLFFGGGGAMDVNQANQPPQPTSFFTPMESNLLWPCFWSEKPEKKLFNYAVE